MSREQTMGAKGKGRAFRDLLGVKPGEELDLAHFDCGATFGRQKAEAETTLAANLARLTDLQERIYAEAKHAVLIVLQGIDAAGKDGTITVIAGAFNPQGTPVTSFKVPTPEELAHDFLWRVHAAVPGKGEIGIFNRSHYEQVLIVRVHNLEPEATWRRHYREIRDWERMLTDEGMTILKFFLAIDKEEQRTRFQERIDDPTKRWKFKTADIAERKFWDDYTAAFEEMLSETSTDYAPWHLVPSNRNWLRNVAVSEIVADTLEGLNPQYPEAEAGVEGLKVV
jgi:PPK2 family polyphosphate:nucleotide phosphotransferase